MMMGMMRHGNWNTLDNSLFLIKYRELFVLIDVACEGLEGVLSSLVYMVGLTKEDW
jgi:hypothetical protein